jgi:hypothetical protein
MSRAIDKLTVFALSLALLYLLIRKDEKVTKHEDKLDLAGYPARSEQFDREIHLEGTNRL